MKKTSVLFVSMILIAAMILSACGSQSKATQFCEEKMEEYIVAALKKPSVAKMMDDTPSNVIKTLEINYTTQEVNGDAFDYTGTFSFVVQLVQNGNYQFKTRLTIPFEATGNTKTGEINFWTGNPETEVLD